MRNTITNAVRIAAVVSIALVGACESIAQVVERERPAEWANLVRGGRFMDRFEPSKAVAPLTSDCTYCMLASVLTGAPSITNDVPNDEASYSLLPAPFVASRRRMVLALVRLGSLVVPPGRVCKISVNDDGCKCCIASLPMTDALLWAVCSCAVTTTSCNVNICSILSSIACWVLFHRNESDEETGNETAPETGTANNRLMNM